MWKQILNNALGTGTQPTALPVPSLPGDKPDYTPVILAAVSLIAIVAVFYFIAKSKA